MAKHRKGKHRAPKRQAPPPAPQGGPAIGPNEFDAGQEQAMRQGAASARMGGGGAPPMPDLDDDGM